MPHHLEGFTLFETLMVFILAVIAILIFFPSFLSTANDAKLRSVAETLQAKIRLSRSTALSQNTDVRLVFQTGANWCYGATTDSTCDCSNSSTDPCSLSTVRSDDLSNQITLSTSGFTSNTAEFIGTRGTLTTTGNIVFTNASSHTITISINKLGIAKLCSNDITGYASC